MIGYREQLSEFFADKDITWARIYSNKGKRVRRIKYYAVQKCGHRSNRPTLRTLKNWSKGMMDKFDFIDHIEYSGHEKVKHCMWSTPPSIHIFLKMDIPLHTPRKNLFYVITKGDVLIESITNQFGVSWTKKHEKAMRMARGVALNKVTLIRDAEKLLNGKVMCAYIKCQKMYEDTDGNLSLGEVIQW